MNTKSVFYSSPFEFSKAQQNEADKLWLYSVGIEIECDKAFDYNLEYFKNIPNIMAVDTDLTEQRYRLPIGFKGMQCLWDLCEGLQRYSLLNMSSGIHYHIDFTDCYQDVIDNLSIPDKSFIIKELESWDYKGTYNRKEVTTESGFCWVRFQKGFKTMECRIGEMTFNYFLLLKRILHLQAISMTIKERCTVNKTLRDFVRDNKTVVQEATSYETIERKVKNRVIKL